MWGTEDSSGSSQGVGGLSKIPIIQPDQSYTFADYFKLNSDSEEILAYFGYSFQPQPLELPKSERELERLEDLKQRLQECLAIRSLEPSAKTDFARHQFVSRPCGSGRLVANSSRYPQEFSMS